MDPKWTNIDPKLIKIGDRKPKKFPGAQHEPRGLPWAIGDEGVMDFYTKKGFQKIPRGGPVKSWGATKSRFGHLLMSLPHLAPYRVWMEGERRH